MAHRYEVVTVGRAGHERRREYASDDELAPGGVIVLDEHHWLVDSVDPSRVVAKPARYRLRLRHPEGREEVGALRRHRPDGPRLGHGFTTLEGGHPVSWQVVEERLARDEDGEPYLDLVAERDYGEAQGDLPNHELEHTMARREWEFPEAARATLARAGQAGLLVELVLLEPGEEPDWEEAKRFIDALVVDEIEDDLLDLCGVGPNDPRDTWLDTVKARLREDLDRFRADVEGDHDEIEVWDFRGGRVLASVGSYEDEADPDSGHGWMCRLLDSEALGAAGFKRVRKTEL